MVIKDIRTYFLKVPVHGNKSALGKFDYYEYGVVFVDTDTDITGVGEVSMLWDGRARTQLSFVEHCFKPVLLGEDPCDVTLCLSKMNTLSEQAHPARAAVEMALLDILGKKLKVPVYALLGGRVRDKIPLSRSIHYDSVDKMKIDAKKYVDAGYRTTGRESPSMKWRPWPVSCSRRFKPFSRTRKGNGSLTSGKRSGRPNN